MKYKKYIFTVTVLAFSISCLNTAHVNQTNAVSQSSADSGTSANSSENSASDSQITAPDTVVKELYRLHNADESPLYKSKSRAEMAKFFSKDFVNLVWTGGSEPNSVNELAIEGDALTGLDSLSKAEGEAIGKAEINDGKATVPDYISEIDHIEIHFLHIKNKGKKFVP